MNDLTIETSTHDYFEFLMTSHDLIYAMDFNPFAGQTYQEWLEDENRDSDSFYSDTESEQEMIEISRKELAKANFKSGKDLEIFLDRKYRERNMEKSHEHRD